MDTAAMYMMAMPAGVLLACLVFKAYGMNPTDAVKDLERQKEGHFGISPDRYNIIFYVLGALLCHMFIHYLLLRFLVIPPKETEGDWDEDEETYPEVGARKPANYFNTNPVHCLRSKYVYNNEPPCVFFRLGREYLLQKNEEIGLYFEGKQHEERDPNMYFSSLEELPDDMDDETKRRAGSKFKSGATMSSLGSGKSGAMGHVRTLQTQMRRGFRAFADGDDGTENVRKVGSNRSSPEKGSAADSEEARPASSRQPTARLGEDSREDAAK
jgi:hypothetical protein